MAGAAEQERARDGPRLLERVSRAIRARRYSPRTEEAYRGWIRRFVRFHGMRHPDELGAEEVDTFLTHLAADTGVSASTQAQARAALVFLYRHVLGRRLDEVGEEVVRGRLPRGLPAVLTRRETGALLRQMRGETRLVAAVLYGAGLRLQEALQLRTKDLDLERGELKIRRPKGAKDRVSVVPASLRTALEDQMSRRRVRTTGIWRPAGAGPRSPTHSRPSPPGPPWRSAGSSCFPPPPTSRPHGAAGVATTCTPPQCSVP